MRLQFVGIGQNLNWPRGRLSLARKKKHQREFMTLALARVIILSPHYGNEFDLIILRFIFNSTLYPHSDSAIPRFTPFRFRHSVIPFPRFIETVNRFNICISWSTGRQV